MDSLPTNHNKYINLISWAIIAALHLCFLVAIAVDFDFSPSSIILTSVGILLIFVAYRDSLLAYANIEWHDLYTFWWLTLGGVSTFLLSTETIAGPVIAAGFIGLIGSFIPQGNNEKSIFHKADVSIYCGAFLGMSSTLVLEHVSQVAAACIISSELYILTKNTLPGYGGKLGTLAFGGVVLFKLCSYGI